MTRTAGIVGAAPRSGARRLVFGGVLVLSATVTLAFLAIPLLALLAEAPLGDVPSLLGDPVMRDIVVVTMRTNAIANLLILGFGTPTAYLFATRRFPGRALAITLVELPLVLPPAVAGIGLLAAFGAGGLLGNELQSAGIVLPFSEWAVVMAVTFVASPFYVRQAIASFEGIDPLLPAASRTLGAGPTLSSSASVNDRSAIEMSSSSLATPSPACRSGGSGR